MNSKHLILVVTTIVALSLTGVAGASSSSTPAPDLIERWVETHQTQAVATAPDLVERWVQAHPFGLEATEGVRALPKLISGHYTAEGLYADGLRLKGIADVYQQLEQRPASQTSSPKLCPRMRWYGPLCISRGILVPD